MNNWDSLRFERIEENTRKIYKALDRFALAMERIADALDRKTENCSEKPNNSTISKMEQVEEPQMGDAKPIPLSNRVTHIKDEPQTE